MKNVLITIKDFSGYKKRVIKSKKKSRYTLDYIPEIEVEDDYYYMTKNRYDSSVIN